MKRTRTKLATGVAAALLALTPTTGVDAGGYWSNDCNWSGKVCFTAWSGWSTRQTSRSDPRWDNGPFEDDWVYRNADFYKQSMNTYYFRLYYFAWYDTPIGPWQPPEGHDAPWRPMPVSDGEGGSDFNSHQIAQF